MKAHGLPQLNGHLMTSGGGFETWMQYVDGFTLRHFCGFELLNDKRGEACLRDYHRRIVEAAIANGFGVINEGLHYRASRDWGTLTGFSREGLEEINIRGIEFYKDFAREYGRADTPMRVGGAIGPRVMPIRSGARRMPPRRRTITPNRLRRSAKPGQVTSRP
jgi:homocysteine S-methyltransferase